MTIGELAEMQASIVGGQRGERTMSEKPPCPSGTRWIKHRVDRFYATPWGQHFKNARKELLLGVRSLLDRRIEWLDSLGQTADAQKIEVE
jgi:hypothetical protein